MASAVLLLELDSAVSIRRLNRLYPVLVQGRHEIAIEIGDATVEEVLAECLAGGVGVRRSRVVREGSPRDQNKQSPDR
jgi:hypothetical protein